MKHYFLFLITLALLFGCQEKTPQQPFEMATVQNEMMPMMRQQKMAQAPDLVNNEIQTEVDKKKIIKDGRIGLKVTNLEKTKFHVDTLVKMFGGYYANESFNNSDLEKTYNLKIRIPASNFEKFVAGINPGKGEILYKNIDARDVTEQFLDLETRLKNKKSYLERYGTLLKRANSVKDILDIQEKIRVIEEEIESVEGRLKYLSDQVNYSTVDLMILTKKDFEFQPTERDSFFERLKESLVKGWFGFVDIFLFIFKIWPFWFIVLGIYFGWKTIRKNKVAKK